MNILAVPGASVQYREPASISLLIHSISFGSSLCLILYWAILMALVGSLSRILRFIFHSGGSFLGTSFTNTSGYWVIKSGTLFSAIIADRICFNSGIQ